MVQVIEGIKHEEFIKDMCKLMFIGENHNINIYINDKLENSISVENNNVIKITAKENDDTEYNIIYMLQKYRFICICNRENKNESVLNIIDDYLANYYMMSLFVDAIENIDNSVLKEMVDKLKNKICNACRANMIKFDDILEKDNTSDEINYLKIIGGMIACRNILRKYSKENNKYITEPNVLGDVLEKLSWNNINEIYEEIEQVVYSYLD